MKIKIENTNSSSLVAAKESRNYLNINDIMNKEWTLFSRGFSLKFKEKFYYKFVVLANSGLDLLAMVELLAKEQKKKVFKVFYERLLADLKGGKTLSEALQASQKFSEFEIYSIKVAEETGNFGVIFKELHLYFKRALKFQKQILSAIAYPVFILGFAFVVIIVLFKFLVPLFSGIYKKFDGELPEITQALITVSEYFSNYIGYLLLGIAIIIFTIYFLRQKESIQKYLALALMHIPLFGPIIKKLYLAKFAQVMALMIKSRVPLLSSVKLLKSIIPFHPIRKAVTQSEADINSGMGFSESLKKASFFPISFISLVKVGEETNNLDGIFNNLTEQYNEEIDQSTELLGKLLEPILIVFIGLIIGVVLVAMYLPLFQMSTRFS